MKKCVSRVLRHPAFAFFLFLLSFPALLLASIGYLCLSPSPPARAPRPGELGIQEVLLPYFPGENGVGISAVSGRSRTKLLRESAPATAGSSLSWKTS